MMGPEPPRLSIRFARRYFNSARLPRYHGFMRFTLRHFLLGVFAVALIVAAWIAVTDHFDHQGDGYSTKQLETVLNSVNESNPVEDVSERINDGDYRYAGCWGEPGGPYFPGVPQSEWQRIRESKNYWTLDGTTDAIESRHHHRLIQRACRYAERYNTSLESRKSHSN